MWSCDHWSAVTASHPVSTCQDYVVVFSDRGSINLYLPCSDAHRTLSCCMWPLKFWYAAMHTINFINYSLKVTSTKQVRDF